MSDAGVWVKLEDAGSSAPGAAVIDSAIADDPDNYPVKTSSFTGNGTNGDKDQNYDVYEFLGSGTLNVKEPGMVDMLIVGGGGSGAIEFGGGGGAGSHLEVTNAYLPAGAMTVTVGAGGAAPQILSGSGGNPGKPGSASRLGSYYGPAGGGGGSRINNYSGSPVPYDTAQVGASGGGGTLTKAGASGFSGIGNNGGAGVALAAGGGGGAGGVGGDGTGTTGGAGGAGASSSITGTAVTRCGGGGGAGDSTGGAAGSGGGGVGVSGASDGGAGTANTGSGGGGTENGNQAGGAGGSGIVIVRVKVAEKSFGDRTRSVTPKTAHAARIENGVVRQVITIPHLDNDDNKITEYCNKIGLPGTWVDTSYTGARRGKYAGVGDLFDPRLRNAEFTSPVEEME